MLPISYKQWSHSLIPTAMKREEQTFEYTFPDYIFHAQVTPEEFFMISILEMKRWETKTFFVCDRKEGRMSRLRNFCYKVSSNMLQISQGQKCPDKCLTNESQRWCFVGLQNFKNVYYIKYMDYKMPYILYKRLCNIKSLNQEI